MDSCFRRNDKNLHSIVIPAEAGIHSYYPDLLRIYDFSQVQGIRTLPAISSQNAGETGPPN